MNRKIKYFLCFISFGLLLSFLLLFSNPIPAYAIASGSINDGVYALRNVSSGKYLDIQNDSVDTGARIQVYSYSSIPNTNEERSGLFKFVHVYNNMYRIYTMRNNQNSFRRISDTEVSTTNTIGSYWTLGTTTDGYYCLKANGTSKYLSAPSNGVNLNKYCTTEALSSAGNRAKWEMIRYTGEDIEGVSIQNMTDDLYCGQTRSIRIAYWTTSLAVSSIAVDVRNSNNWLDVCQSTIDSSYLISTGDFPEIIDICVNIGGIIYYNTYEVKQAIENGVYSFKNTFSNMYMDVRGDSTQEGHEIQQYNYSNTPDSESLRAGLFKVKYYPNQGYEIRLMTNNSLYLGTIIENDINYIDSTSNRILWNIIRNNDGEILINNTSGNIGVLNDTSSGRNANNDSRLRITDDITKVKWIPYKSNEEFSSGSLFYNKSRIVYDNSIPIYEENTSNSLFSTSYYYSTNVDINSEVIADNIELYDPSGEISQIAYYDPTDNMIKRYNERVGMVSICAEYEHGESYDANIYFGPNTTFTGEYFFMQNIQSEIGFIEVNDYYCQKSSFTYGDIQIWKRTPVEDEAGYYYIQNMNGMYLTAPNSNDVGAYIGLITSLNYYGHDPRQLWSFDGGNNNGYKIKSKNQQNLYLNVNSNNILVQDTYINNSFYYDEFNIILIGKKNNSEVIYQRSFGPNIGFDIIDPSITVSELYKQYNSFTLAHLENYFGPTEIDKDNTLNMIASSKVAIICGHGSPSVIAINEQPERYLKNTNIITFREETRGFSDVEIIIFAGCSTAGETTISYNMPDSANRAGAKVAIGWSTTQYGNEMNDWIDYFFTLLFSLNEYTGSIYTAEQALNDTNHHYRRNGNHIVSQTVLYDNVYSEENYNEN